MCCQHYQIKICDGKLNLNLSWWIMDSVGMPQVIHHWSEVLIRVTCISANNCTLFFCEVLDLCISLSKRLSPSPWNPSIYLPLMYMPCLWQNCTPAPHSSSDSCSSPGDGQPSLGTRDSLTHSESTVIVVFFLITHYRDRLDISFTAHSPNLHKLGTAQLKAHKPLQCLWHFWPPKPVMASEWQSFCY